MRIPLILFLTPFILIGCGDEGLSLEEEIAAREAAMAEAKALPKTAHELYTPIEAVNEEQLVQAVVEQADVEPQVEVGSVQPGSDGKLDLEQFAGVESVQALSNAVEDNRRVIRALALDVNGIQGSIDALATTIAEQSSVQTAALDPSTAPHEFLPPDLEALYEPEDQWRAELRGQIALIREMAEAARMYSEALETFRSNRSFMTMLARMHPELQPSSDLVGEHLAVYESVMNESGTRRTSEGVAPKLLFTDGTSVMVEINKNRYTTVRGERILTPEGDFEVLEINPNGTVQVEFDDEIQELSI